MSSFFWNKHLLFYIYCVCMHVCFGAPVFTITCECYSTHVKDWGQYVWICSLFHHVDPGVWIQFARLGRKSLCLPSLFSVPTTNKPGKLIFFYHLEHIQEAIAPSNPLGLTICWPVSLQILAKTSMIKALSIWQWLTDTGCHSGGIGEDGRSIHLQGRAEMPLSR